MTAPAATAAEALSGLARIRPAGWLGTALPQDPEGLLALARRALETDHPGVTGELTMLAARYTAAVFTVGGTQEPLVLKLHADPAAFAGESLAYALLGSTAPVPMLHGEGEASLSLLLEYLPEPADWTARSTPAALVECVAAVHTATTRLSSPEAAALGGFTLAATKDTAPTWISDTGAWAEVTAAHLDAYGADVVPLGHLDLKPQHLRRRANRTLALLDTETVRPDVTGLIDLVTLPAVMRQAGRELPAAHVLDLYLEAVWGYGARWSAQSLRAALRAFATATGLHDLHGLA
ncbi:hypothetical protein [Kitasatospora sp. NPDC098663]|uniref:hypothetical protein n=1 Tax=Kitasatospora sp. NPDC098663 TaxID=3364096 RepID=UPI0037FAEA1F